MVRMANSKSPLRSPANCSSAPGISYLVIARYRAKPRMSRPARESGGSRLDESGRAGPVWTRWTGGEPQVAKRKLGWVAPLLLLAAAAPAHAQSRSERAEETVR